MKAPLAPGLAAGAYALTQRMAANPMAAIAKDPSSNGAFAEILEATVGRAASAGRRADLQTQSVASGQPTDLVEVVTAVAESEAAMETLVAVRDRVVSAYEEIMRMPI